MRLLDVCVRYNGKAARYTSTGLNELVRNADVLMGRGWIRSVENISNTHLQAAVNLHTLNALGDTCAHVFMCTNWWSEAFVCGGSLCRARVHIILHYSSFVADTRLLGVYLFASRTTAVLNPSRIRTLGTVHFNKSHQNDEKNKREAAIILNL